MQRITNIASLLMMTIVLLLGVVMPSLPNLDDGDENVGCAAVIHVAARKNAIEKANDEPKRRQRAAVAASGNLHRFAPQATETIAPAIVVLTQIRPPLRP